ncbi:MAG TPA: methyltransferase domain-containing protein [Dehalococcoidia bacterium]|nr:methyltransferase domain-containing protein [Dehalococcoidia bacterium]
MTVTQALMLDEQKLNEFIGKAVGDFGTTLSTALVVIGDQLGLYRALAARPLTSAELSEDTQTAERYVREWLVNQAAGGYLEYDPLSGRYSLPPEHAIALTQEDSPAYVVGGYQVVSSLVLAFPRILQAFRDGSGMLWGEHDENLFEGTERFFKPGYLANLVDSWLPALDGIDAKLRQGGTVADVGCGLGASTIIMAQAYPNSRFVGYDNHAPSIEAAREAAARAGVADRVAFEVASAADYPAAGRYDLIAFFDCLHDMGDPSGAMRHALEALAPDGAVMIVEPMAGDRIEDNLNPVGRVFSGASTLVCTPNAVASGGEALGTLAPEAAIADVVRGAGFSSFRRATETPFNRIFEAKR